MKNTLVLYIGGYTNQAQEGIRVYRYDPFIKDASAFQLIQTLTDLPNPSFLSLNAEGTRLYTVSESGKTDGPGGSAAAFAIEPTTGELTLLNRESTGASGPCHISLSTDGKFAYVANYGGQAVSLFSIEKNGLLSPVQDVVMHAGSGPNPERQQEPHPHSVTPDPAGVFAFVADLGIDRLVVYRTVEEVGRARLIRHGETVSTPGAGPRHMALHPSGAYAYVANELQSTVTVLAYDGERGEFSPLETISTLSEQDRWNNTTAEIAVSADGRFLYVSNRGHDSIAAFAIHDGGRRIELLEQVPSGGSCPRHFLLSPEGTRLLVANQLSGTVSVMEVDPASGRLFPMGVTIPVNEPSCLRFWQGISQGS